MSEEANIDAYFERIGFAGSIAPTLETLETLHLAHVAAIPFENIDPLLGIPVRLELSNLQQKLLFEKRGGYCVEQNLLFKAVLETLGFAVRGLGAKMLSGLPAGAEPVMNHMLLAIDIGGVTHLADVGFGGSTLTTAIKLRSDAEQETPHETVRLLGGEPEWRLEARIGEDWQALYAFELVDRSFEDFQAINDAASAAPLFRDNLLAARAERGRRLGLGNAKLNIHAVGGVTETRMLESIDEIKDTLTSLFGISLAQTDRLDPALERVLLKGTI